MLYAVADRLVRSALPLPELRRMHRGVADWVVRVGSATAAPVPSKPYHYWNAARGHRWASFSRCGEGVILRFARTAAFVIDGSFRTVTCHPIGRSGEDVVRPVLLNQVLPLLFGEQRLALHASAVATPAGALVFAGAPGLGKSTLASALALRGFPLITDDFLVVDQRSGVPEAVSSGIEPRLWPDSLDAILPGSCRRFPLVGRRTTKRRISPAAAAGVTLAERRVSIASVFVLSESRCAGTIGRLGPAESVSALTASTFVTRVDEPAVAREVFERVTALVAAVRVFQLGAARDFRALGALCDAVQEVRSPRAPLASSVACCRASRSEANGGAYGSSTVS